MPQPDPDLIVRGVRIFKGFLNGDAQMRMVEDVRDIAQKAPLFAPMTPYGKPMSVRMTSAGRLGWFSDRSGYRYRETHPNGTAWPPIPISVLDVWHGVTGLDREPDCCLINYYAEGSRMGLHQDKDEVDFQWPVVSISLGADGLFRIGGPKRKDPTESIWLKSGDVVVMGDEARLSYHGIDRIRAGSPNLLSKGGRLNLTLRVVAI